MRSQGNSPSYIDLGDCHQRCHHWRSLFWYGERLKGKQKDFNLFEPPKGRLLVRLTHVRRKGRWRYTIGYHTYDLSNLSAVIIS
uniref:Helitron helicase-like domain-containing protein n=1 Tax=Tanacetum cinerariifolium TaxID=118510 RepID=A0A6L2JRM8_TANCI|nr:helitron helicase-like domain-containing protein [Tanacetum cinerariifolium]